MASRVEAAWLASEVHKDTKRSFSAPRNGFFDIVPARTLFEGTRLTVVLPMTDELGSARVTWPVALRLATSDENVTVLLSRHLGPRRIHSLTLARRPSRKRPCSDPGPFLPGPS